MAAPASTFGCVVSGVAVKSHVLAVLSALVIAVGVAMVYLPAGVITAGIEGVAGAYVLRYLEARK